MKFLEGTRRLHITIQALVFFSFLGVHPAAAVSADVALPGPDRVPSDHS